MPDKLEVRDELRLNGLCWVATAGISGLIALVVSDQIALDAIAMIASAVLFFLATSLFLPPRWHLRASSHTSPDRRKVIRDFVLVALPLYAFGVAGISTFWQFVAAEADVPVDVGTLFGAMGAGLFLGIGLGLIASAPRVTDASRIGVEKK